MAFSSIARPTLAEIDLDALSFNFRSVREFVGSEVGLMAVVKADAYGHGAVQCAKRLEAEGVDWFAVATVEEGVELREARVGKPILVLGGFWPGQEFTLLNLDLTPVIFRLDQARAFSDAAKQQGSIARVHVKIDTGMGRIGIRPEEVPAFATELAGSGSIEVEGLMTHLAVADDLSLTDFTNRQIAAFSEAVDIFHSLGHRPRYIDLANSPGAVAHPLSRSTMVRIGGILYGLGGDVLPPGVPHPELQRVMSIRSAVAQIKTIHPGDSVGYGRTFIAEQETVVATVPIGYQDGIPRTLSNKGHFLINGRCAPIIGRVSMDWTTLDVTGITDVGVGDDVTIIGISGNEIIRAEDLAAHAETISYEITCGISRRVPRLYKSI